MFFRKIGGAVTRASVKASVMSKGKVLVVMSSANALDLRSAAHVGAGFR
jgi:hypothetical protein